MTRQQMIAAGVPAADVLGPKATRMLFHLMTIGRPVTLRELGRVAGCSYSWAWICVKVMVGMGLVKLTRSSRTKRKTGVGIVPTGVFKLEIVRAN